MENTNVKPAEGKLGIMVVGCGAVATTFMTGVLMTRKGLTKPIGSMTQYDKIRVGRGSDKKYLHYKDIVPLADLKDIVFGTWDVYPQNAYQATVYAEVLKASIKTTQNALMATMSNSVRHAGTWWNNCGKTSVSSKKHTDVRG